MASLFCSFSLSFRSSGLSAEADGRSWVFILSIATVRPKRAAAGCASIRRRPRVGVDMLCPRPGSEPAELLAARAAPLLLRDSCWVDSCCDNPGNSCCDIVRLPPKLRVDGDPVERRLLLPKSTKEEAESLREIVLEPKSLR